MGAEPVIILTQDWEVVEHNTDGQPTVIFTDDNKVHVFGWVRVMDLAGLDPDDDADLLAAIGPSPDSYTKEDWFEFWHGGRSDNDDMLMAAGRPPHTGKQCPMTRKSGSDGHQRCAFPAGHGQPGGCREGDHGYVFHPRVS